MKKIIRTSQVRRGLTPWELPTLLTPLHVHRQTKKKKVGKERKHYPAILSFVYRNRFAVASQIQRRFANQIRSDRTARRHLEEMQHLGWLDIAPTSGVSPLWPKVYFVTGRGVRKLRDEMSSQGKEWKPGRIDRKSRHRREGFSSERIVHEILLTEFLLAVWQTVRGRPDLQLLTIQRRSLARHAAFDVVVDGRTSHLAPDGLFLFRQTGGGMIASLVELDTGEMNLKKIKTKLQRYLAWSRSDLGRQYLVDLYRSHGATDPQPNFRILFAANDRTHAGGQTRLRDLLRVGLEFPGSIRDKIWLTSVEELHQHQDDVLPLGASVWRRARDAREWTDEYKRLKSIARSVNAQKKMREFLVEKCNGLPLHPLFPHPTRKLESE